jgi:hypothetical protein
MVVGTVVTMRHRGIPFDLFTYISALRASSVGRRLHGLVVHNMFQSRTSVMNVLVDMYFRAGLKETAVATFGQIQRKDTVSWSTVIPCLANDGDERAAAAASCFIHMPTSGSKPNQVLPSGIRPCLP